MEDEVYKIRYASVKEAADLGYIHSTSWQVAYKGIIPDEILSNFTVSKREKYFAKALAEESEDDAIIYKDNKAVGFICIGKCRDEDKSNEYGEIGGLYLLPDYFRHGIGSKLINWGINELKKRGFKKVTLWVLEDNINAIEFYEKIGFKFDGTIKELSIGKKINECRYVKDIFITK